MWRFRCYDSGRNRGGFHQWYDAQSIEARAEIDAALEILTETKEWTLPLFSDLEGACAGLSELRIDIPGQPEDEISCIRILGFQGPEKREYTMLRGFVKVSGAEYGAECVKAKWAKVKIEKDGRHAPDFEGWPGDSAAEEANK